ncbi:MAG: DMT family transporter [Acidimicrobiales bacterium]
MTRRGWILFAGVCFLGGIPYLLIKIAVRDLSPVSVVFLRTGVGAVVLLPIAAARGDLRPLLRAWRWVLAFMVAEVTAPYLLLSVAEQRLPSSLTGLLVAAVPLATAIILLLMRTSDHLGLWRALGLVVGFVGVAVLLGLDNLRGDLISLALIGVVVVGYALGAIIVAYKLRDLPATGVIAASLGLTAIVCAPLGIATMPLHLPGLPVIGAVLGLGVFCTPLLFLLFFALIADAGPLRAQITGYVNPAVALLLGVVVLGESLTFADILGFALILGGLLVATRGRRHRSPAPPTACNRILGLGVRPIEGHTPGQGSRVWPSSLRSRSLAR